MLNDFIKGRLFAVFSLGTCKLRHMEGYHSSCSVTVSKKKNLNRKFALFEA